MNQELLYEFIPILDKKKWTKKELAAKSGVNYSDIIRIFNNKKMLSFHCLEAITQAIGLPVGAFYYKYTQLCFNQNGYLDKRRSMAYIYKCALYGFHKELNYMLNLILEESSKTIRTKNYLILFQVAEKLFLEGNEKEALPLYKLFIELMPDNTSEEIAISYFRKFYIIRLTEEGQATIVYLLEYISYMPMEFQELTYLWITATFYTLKQWDKVFHYAKRLEKIAQIEDHYGRALMYQCFALTRLGGSLDEVMAIIDQYEIINEYYSDIAIGNRFVALIDFGELNYVDEYRNWLRNRTDQFVGIPRILEAYVKLGRLEDATDIIYHHENEMIKLKLSSTLNQQNLYLDYCYAFSLYKCERKEYTAGLNELIDVAERAKNIGIFEKFKQCLIAIWKYRNYMTPELEQRYIKLLSLNENQQNQLNYLGAY
ncbi:helix-turn-helix domain-containing protein [Gottfriedia sp. NPDC056225]|uniref:helix-turn-helix domain-containing protein n=1 Tax=Gottfriedia sp. NPDC056225 TaxID=3345751 RepID=UPI0035DA1108